ncbi:MAG: phosphoribosyltransferase family protein [Planctomycetota bacterium]
MAEQTRSRAQGEESEQDSQEYQRLREKLAGCIRTGEITLSSGKVTAFSFDGRLVSLDPEGSVLLGGLMLEALLARGITAVGGLTSGADPLTSSIGVLAWQRQVPMNLFFVRKERKEHGMQQRVEGPPMPEGEGLKVALVDDVLTTGGSLLQAREALVEELGVEPSVACVIVDREEGGEQRLADYGIETVALFRKSDFL